MTKKERTFYRQAAQKAMKENGMKVFQKDIILLETGCSYETVLDIKIQIVDYVMFEDNRTGKQFQCWYGAKYYNADLDTLWFVQEYAP